MTEHGTKSGHYTKWYATLGGGLKLFLPTLSTWATRAIN